MLRPAFVGARLAAPCLADGCALPCGRMRPALRTDAPCLADGCALPCGRMRPAQIGLSVVCNRVSHHRGFRKQNPYSQIVARRYYKNACNGSRPQTEWRKSSIRRQRRSRRRFLCLPDGPFIACIDLAAEPQRDLDSSNEFRRKGCRYLCVSGRFSASRCPVPPDTRRDFRHIFFDCEHNLFDCGPQVFDCRHIFFDYRHFFLITDTFF